jgi:hypothetical protein
VVWWQIVEASSLDIIIAIRNGDGGRVLLMPARLPSCSSCRIR